VTPLYPQKLALTSPTGGGRSVGVVRSRTKATEFSLVFYYVYLFGIKEVIVSYFIFEVQVFVFDLLNKTSSASVYRVSIAGPRQTDSSIAGTSRELHSQMLATFHR
jgi:hypothetical protein